MGRKSLKFYESRSRCWCQKQIVSRDDEIIPKRTSLDKSETLQTVPWLLVQETTCFDHNFLKSTNFSASRPSWNAEWRDLALGAKSNFQSANFHAEISRNFSWHGGSAEPAVESAKQPAHEKFRLISASKSALNFFFLHQQRDLVEFCFKHLWPKEKFVDFEDSWSKQV